MEAFKKTERFTPMEGAPHVFIRESIEVAVSYSLEQLPVGRPVEFTRSQIDIGSLRSMARRLEKNKGMSFRFSNPKGDNWSTAEVCRLK